MTFEHDFSDSDGFYYDGYSGIDDDPEEEDLESEDLTDEEWEELFGVDPLDNDDWMYGEDDGGPDDTDSDGAFLGKVGGYI